MAAEIEYNTITPAIHFWLLTLGYEPFIASTIASPIAIIDFLLLQILWHTLHAYLKGHKIEIFVPGIRLNSNRYEKYFAETI
jgi:hypothetical protein